MEKKVTICFSFFDPPEWWSRKARVRSYKDFTQQFLTLFFYPNIKGKTNTKVIFIELNGSPQLVFSHNLTYNQRCILVHPEEMRRSRADLLSFGSLQSKTSRLIMEREDIVVAEFLYHQSPLMDKMDNATRMINMSLMKAGCVCLYRLNGLCPVSPFLVRSSLVPPSMQMLMLSKDVSSYAAYTFFWPQ